MRTKPDVALLSPATALAAMLAAVALGHPRQATAEGTAQLGVNQDIRDAMTFYVDVIDVGEIINISAGSNSSINGDPITVNVFEPGGTSVNGSPFVISPGSPGWLGTPDIVPTAADILNPLRITTQATGRFQITMTVASTERLIDPLDITVTPNLAAPIDPSNPPGGFGRLHSRQWAINAHSFGQSASSNAAFFVLTPTGPQTDYTWKLQFSGLAGFIFDVAGNSIGLPPPNSGFSEDETLSNGPLPEYDVYLNVPEVAEGGVATAVLGNFEFLGPNSVCQCAIATLSSRFSFESDRNGVYEITIDTNQDGSFDSAAGDVILRGPAVTGPNFVTWTGTGAGGVTLPAGTYDARLAVRIGEFHFVGRDIETSRPGLRIFGIDPPLPTTTPTSARMYWDDSRVNSTLSPSHQTQPNGAVPLNQRSSPEETFSIGGLSSGDPNAATECGVNSHCWGNFEAGQDPRSPGNWRFIDTFTFFTESVLLTTACIDDGAADPDGDGLSTLDECRGPEVSDPQLTDTDGDQLPDGVERDGGTDPNDVDSDDDLIPDGVEDRDRDGTVDPDETSPVLPDTDGDSIPDGVEDIDHDGTFDPGETDPVLADTDGDLVPDGIEDADHDGVVDPGETDPRVGDSDGDLIPDGVEDLDRDGTVDPGETSPVLPDTDGDGLDDGVEDSDQDGMFEPGETDPNNPDTDLDLIPDGVEDSNGDGILDPGETDPSAADTDGDGLDDGVEDADQDGALDAGETDPEAADTDGDLLPDGLEDEDRDGMVSPGETDPRSADSDGDALPDGVEDANQNGTADAGETDPTRADTDRDGLGDGAEDADHDGTVDPTETSPLEDDTDGDGLDDGLERGVNADGAPIDGATLTDPLLTDTDGDGLSDGEEDSNASGTLNSRETDPSEADTDGDGLGDGIELGVDAAGMDLPDANPTDPRSADTDNDGIPDGVEDANQDGTYDAGPLPDGETNPVQVDTDGDSLNDGVEDANQNGVLDPTETDPRLVDTDGGGETDGDEVNRSMHDPRDPSDDRLATVGLFGGGGCVCVTPARSAGGAEGALVMGLLLGALGIRRRLRRGGSARMTRGARATLLRVVAACGVVASGAGSARAQVSFPVANYKPVASSLGYYTTDTGKILEHLHPSVSLYGGYEHLPLRLIDLMSGADKSEVISSRVNLDLLVAVGFWDRLELGLAVPVTLAQSSGDLDILDRPPGESLGGGFGDIRLIPKLRVGTAGPMTFAISLPVGLPTGNTSALIGTDGPTFAPRAILSFETARFGFALNAGYNIRKYQGLDFSASQARIALGDEVFGSAGVRIGVLKDRLDLLGNIFAAANIKEQDPEEVPVEALGGLRLHFARGFTADAAAGAGITKGIGAPAFRALLGLTWRLTDDPDPDEDGILGTNDKCPTDPEDKDGYEDTDGCPDLDRDKDGLDDSADKCPDDPEDKDEFQDADGCPDPDNDKDTILDDADKCRNEAEDKDNFEDTDGCPELDNDKDGINDAKDTCPIEAEDVDGYDDTDGCPEGDNDKDGVLDANDRCKEQPEDRDGFEDTDGCPELDNDFDKLADAADRCPMEPEDLDNFEDADGCPEPDNDKDGVLDASDKCPNEPESINGFEDTDGCPDQKPNAPVKIEHGKITTPPLFFATGKDRILPQSLPFLNLVAQIFKDNPWIKKVRIEGHTDSVGSPKTNLSLSQRRTNSVMSYLIESGVDPARLEAIGYGQSRPIASNKTETGRAQNRRVEFVILDPPQSQLPGTTP